jgi:hypothetical protein
VRAHRGAELILLAFATVVTAAGCTSAPDASTSTTSPSSAADSTPGATAPTGEPPEEGVGPPPEEEAGPPPEEEGGGPEDPAVGPDTVSVEFAGLPVGGSGATLVEEGWCQVLFWNSAPDGVVLRIERVVIGLTGGSVVDAGCMGAAPCAGWTISSEQSGGCAVLVRPPNVDATEVDVRLDGVVECPDAATCESLSLGSGGFTTFTRPADTTPTPSVPDGSDDGDPSVPGDFDEDSDQTDDSGAAPGDDTDANTGEPPSPGVPGDG